MKKYQFLLMVLCTNPSFGQLEIQRTNVSQSVNIGEVTKVGTFVAELKYKLENSDTMVSLIYRNYKYVSLNEVVIIHFKSNNGTIEQLYGILKSVFLEENRKNKDYSIQFKIGNKDVIIATNILKGVTSAMLYTDDGYCYLVEKQIDKLFGKK